MKRLLFTTLLSLLPLCAQAAPAPPNIKLGDTALFFNAVSHGCMDMVKKFHRLGMRTDSKAGFNMSPLMSATDFNQLEMVDFYISLNVDLNETNSVGRTALMIAAMRGYTDIVRHLIEAGADPSKTDKGGKNAESIAEQNGHPELQQLIKEARIKLQ